MTSIHERILERLFMPVGGEDGNDDQDSGAATGSADDKAYYLIDSDEEQEPEDHSLEMHFSYALASHIGSQYESVKESFKEGTLKRELADELMDVVDSELFAGALYELLAASFKSTIVNYLSDQLQARMQARDKSSKALLEVPLAGQQMQQSQQSAQSEEALRIAVVQLTTIFYQLQNSGMIQSQLAQTIRDTIKIELRTEEVSQSEPTGNIGDNTSKAASGNTFALYEAQLGQLLKFVFFESRQAQEIPLESPCTDLEQFERQAAAAAAGGGDPASNLFSMLGGGGGGADDLGDLDENGDEMQMIKQLLSGAGGQGGGGAAGLNALFAPAK